MNPLDQHPKIREYLYILQWIMNLIFGAIGVALTVVNISPMWYIMAVSVLNFIWTYTGITAKQNVNTSAINDAE